MEWTKRQSKIQNRFNRVFTTDKILNKDPIQPSPKRLILTLDNPSAKSRNSLSISSNILRTNTKRTTKSIKKSMLNFHRLSLISFNKLINFMQSSSRRTSQKSQKRVISPMSLGTSMPMENHYYSLNIVWNFASMSNSNWVYLIVDSKNSGRRC